ncbi:MAG: restriction endonuclease subunit S, partial [Methylotenera sp.]
VLIVQTGAGTGDIGLVTENEEGFNCHALIIVQAKKDIAIGDYVSMVFQSQYGCSVLYSIRTGGMHPHLNCGEVQFVKLPVPPLDEQDHIVEYISQQIYKFDALVERQLKAIELMKERRTALISAAVTGKIDVRNWQAPAI